jgi:hypothetical protein
MEQSEQFDPKEYLIQVRGGTDYLEVKWRLVWFRNDHPYGQIFTEVQEHDRDTGYARVKARVQFDYVSEDGTTRTAIAESTGTETISDFADYLEKAETKAIGRALAALGYGTQFAEDFDMRNPDGSQHVVDAPVESPKRAKKGKSKNSQASFTQDEAPEAAEEPTEITCEGCGQVLTPTKPRGDKKGMTVQEKADFSKRRMGRVLCYECYQGAFSGSNRSVA